MISWTDPAIWADTVFEAVAGETLSVPERLVVSPCDGRIRIPEGGHAAGEYVKDGEVVAHVASADGRDLPIRSPFSGWVRGYLVPDGSPVRASEPVLWLRKP